ncbi:hypothetical protein Bca4012_016804 [Brassica carinata]
MINPCILFNLLFFSFTVKSFIYGGSMVDFSLFQSTISISGLVPVTMIDDNPVMLNQRSSGKELILTALLWKQVPWKPPWCVIVIGMEVMQPQRYSKFLKITIQNIYGWFFIGDAVSLLYGDVVRIIENWQFQFLFLLRKSIHWIFSQKIIYRSYLESGQCYTT